MLSRTAQLAEENTRRCQSLKQFFTRIADNPVPMGDKSCPEVNSALAGGFTFLTSPELKWLTGYEASHSMPRPVKHRQPEDCAHVDDVTHLLDIPHDSSMPQVGGLWWARNESRFVITTNLQSCVKPLRHQIVIPPGRDSINAITGGVRASTVKANWYEYTYQKTPINVARQHALFSGEAFNYAVLLLLIKAVQESSERAFDESIYISLGWANEDTLCLVSTNPQRRYRQRGQWVALAVVLEEILWAYNEVAKGRVNQATAPMPKL